MIFPNHFTQTQRTTASLEELAMNLESAAAAVRAVIAQTATKLDIEEITTRTTGDGYDLIFGSLSEVRCFSCGAMNWGLKWSDHGCPTCTKHNEENKFCASCERWFPNAEFEHPFYCHQSDGMESETTEVCTECLREQNEADGDDPQY